MENELARAKWLLCGLALFLISACISYQEFAYLVNGHDAQANVTKVYESQGRRGSRYLTVEYTFTESDGTHRKGMNSVSTDWPVPSNGKVEVRYTPGADGSSRLAGRVGWIGLGLFAFSTICVLIFIIRLLREGMDEPKPRKNRRHSPL